MVPTSASGSRGDRSVCLSSLECFSGQCCTVKHNTARSTTKARCGRRAEEWPRASEDLPELQSIGAGHQMPTAQRRENRMSRRSMLNITFS
eukprot:5892426-Alexandrium_andersonii.AAC.1